MQSRTSVRYSDTGRGNNENVKNGVLTGNFSNYVPLLIEGESLSWILIAYALVATIF